MNVDFDKLKGKFIGTCPSCGANLYTGCILIETFYPRDHTIYPRNYYICDECKNDITDIVENKIKQEEEMNKQNTEALAKIIEGIDEETKKKIIEFVKGIKEEKKKDDRIWKPKRGKQYFIITSDGTIAPRIATDEYISACFEMGNAFRTLREAEFEVEKRKVKAELKRYALEHNDSDREEWDGRNWHYYIKCFPFPECGTLEIGDLCSRRSESVTYFTSEKIAEDAIKVIGQDRIKKYLFEVEEYI